MTRIGNRALSPDGSEGRLAVVASLVPRGSRVADIGSCDGGLALTLLESGRAPWCVATERTRRAGAAMELLPRRADLAIRFGDGLDPLRPDDRVDVVVMSGMGARTAIRILERGERRHPGLSRVVIQPQTEATTLRRWLVERGYGIVDERIALDRGRVYVALAAERGAPTPRHPRLDTEALLAAGPCLLRSPTPLLESYWERERGRLERILDQASDAPGIRRARSRHGVAVRVLAEIRRDCSAGRAGL